MIEPLVTLEQLKAMTPYSQGYVIYMQAELPGSELKHHQLNPFEVNSKEWLQWNKGQCQAIIAVLDEVE